MSLQTFLATLKKRGHAGEDHREGGFTLIEVIIVVIILGVLAAIMVPIFSNQQRAAQDAVLQQDIRNVATSMTQWLTVGGTLANTKYVDVPFHYVAKINETNRRAWPVMAAGMTNQVFDGMSPLNVTLGTRAGIKIIDPSVGFCVAAARDGSNFDSISSLGSSDTNRMLFYDSVTGETSPRTELTSTGACAYFIDSFTLL